MKPAYTETTAAKKRNGPLSVVDSLELSLQYIQGVHCIPTSDTQIAYCKAKQGVVHRYVAAMLMHKRQGQKP